MNRRTILQGLALGATGALLTPLLTRLVREAQGNDELPLRFVLIDSQQGWDADRFEPPNADLAKGGLNPSMRSLPMSPEISGTEGWHPSMVVSPRGVGLGKYADRIILVDELYNYFNMGLHGNGHARLTFEPSPLDDPNGVDSGDRHKTQSGRELQDVVAEHIGAETPFPTIIASAADNPEGPYEFYNRYFAELDLSEQKAALSQLERRRKRLDLVRGDVDRVKKQLASREREKMDVYLASLGKLDAALTRQSRALNLSCQRPDAPPEGLPLRHLDYGPISVARYESLLESGLNALVCGLSNVLVVRPVPSRGNWHFLRNEKDKHDTQHDFISGTEEAKVASKDHLVNIDQWICGQVTEIADRLAAMPEGDGTALDRTLILWIDDNGGNHHTGDYDKVVAYNGSGVDVHRALLLGNPTGYFRKTGIWKRYERRKYSTGDLFTTTLNALGVPAEHYGDQSVAVAKGAEMHSVAEHNHGPLPGLT